MAMMLMQTFYTLFMMCMCLVYNNNIMYVHLPRMSAEELKQITHAFINMNYFPKDTVRQQFPIESQTSYLYSLYIY